jgi:hypothetical protein
MLNETVVMLTILFFLLVLKGAPTWNEPKRPTTTTFGRPDAFSGSTTATPRVGRRLLQGYQFGTDWQPSIQHLLSRVAGETEQTARPAL